MITIEKAIEILSVRVQHYDCILATDELDAVKLGIEAMKSVKHSRLIFPDVEVGLLPGEGE